MEEFGRQRNRNQYVGKVGWFVHDLAKYRTELCRNYKELGECRYGERDLRRDTRQRHPRYKTVKCMEYHREGLCPYGTRCAFIHDDENGVATAGAGDSASAASFMATISNWDTTVSPVDSTTTRFSSTPTDWAVIPPLDIDATNITLPSQSAAITTS